MRFVQKALDLDWDQRQAAYSAEPGKDLVFRYPLTLANRLNRELTVRLELVPVKTEKAEAKLAEQRVTLKARETRTVEATLTLPAAVAAKKPPLYAERFLARARAEEVADSEVTILRSSDHGKTFRALVNFETDGVEVRLGNLRTTQRFATDHAGE